MYPTSEKSAGQSRVIYSFTVVYWRFKKCCFEDDWKHAVDD